jgi:hypothetical protein
LRLYIARASAHACYPLGAPGDGSAVHLDNLILDVLLDPFLLGKRLVRDGVISIDVFGAINPQPSKLGYRRETGHGRTVLLLGFGFRCSLSEFLDHRINSDLMLLCDLRLQPINQAGSISPTKEISQLQADRLAAVFGPQTQLDQDRSIEYHRKVLILGRHLA